MIYKSSRPTTVLLIQILTLFFSSRTHCTHFFRTNVQATSTTRQGLQVWDLLTRANLFPSVVDLMRSARILTSGILKYY